MIYIKYYLKIVSFILIILFLNNLIIVNGYIVKDVSIDSTYYKSYLSDEDTCNFVIDILCIPTIAGDNCDDLQNSVVSSLVVNIIQLTELKNPNGSIASKYGIVVSNYGILNILFGNDVLNPSLTVSLECIELNLDIISFELVSGYLLFSSTESGISIMGEYKVNGIQSDISFSDTKTILDSSMGQDCTAQPGGLGSNSILLLCMSLPFNYNPSLIQMTVKSGLTKSKVFNLEPLNNIFESYQVVEYKTYPDLIYLEDENYQLMGYNRVPVLSYKINSPNINKGYYMMNVNDQQVVLQVTPIYSDESSTTLFSPLSTISNNINYDFYYQSGNNIQKVTELNINVNQYEFSGYQSITTTNTYIDGYPILTFGFGDSTSRIDLPSFRIFFNQGDSVQTRFPYGFLSGSAKNGFEYQVSAVVKSSYKDSSNLQINLEIPANSWSTMSTFIPLNTTFNYDESLAPSIISSEVFYLDNQVYLLRIGIQSPYGFNYILDSNSKLIGVESLVDGDITNGVYEFTNFDYFVIHDQVSSVISLFQNDILYIKDENVIRNSQQYKTIPNFDRYSIESISYLKNQVDVTNHRVYNVLYFNYSDIVPRDTVFSILPNNNLNNQNDANMFTSSWNDTIKLFQIEFFIEANTGSGDFQFILYIKSQLQMIFSSAFNVQLKVINKNLDNQGPIFKEINKIELNNIIDGINYKYGIIGWSFNIEDKINGFDYGYIVIKGEIDQSNYNITINNRDINQDGRYDIKLNISYPCITQDYIIDQVKLYDHAGRISYFSIYDEFAVSDSVLNPFLYYLNDTLINKINLECLEPTTLDTTAPVIVSFQSSISSTREIDVGKTNRTISFQFVAVDNESALKNNVYPSVYITNSNNQILECKTYILQYSNKSAAYRCSIDLPLGYGYPGIILYSLYGLTNNHGMFSGYSSQSLSFFNFEYMATTKYSMNEPSLCSNMKFTDRSTSLWVYGKSLLGTTNAIIKYSDNSTDILQPSIKYSTAIKISNIKQNQKRPFQIYIETSSNLISNTLIIKPIVFDYYLPNCNNNGIINQLSQQIECICNSKWITLDLSSQCTIPNHYISSSTQVLPTTGGEITLYGWFGSVHNNPSLYINNKQIQLDTSTITSDSIKATIEIGNLGPVQVCFIQNSITFNGTIYPYLSIEKECPSKCSINGICDKTIGMCICNSSFTGLDCSSPIIINSNGTNNSNDTIKTETEINNNGTIIIKNNDLEYLIFINSIIELDIYGNQVSIFNLTNNWELLNQNGVGAGDSSSDDNLISTFIQKRINNDNTISTIKLIIEQVFNKDKEFSFAGNQFIVSKDGLKLTLSISNWNYASNLNTLQLIMSSDIQIDTSSNQCNQDSNGALIESSSNNNYLSNNINYLKVTKNSRSFYARFQDRMLADNKTATILAQLLNSNDNNKIIIALNLPKCNECLIDPDFSLLITSNYKFNCNNNSNNNKTIIAVAVSVGVGALVIIVVSLYLIYKKSTVLKIKVYSLKKSLLNKV